jgi:hypothetical protein
MSFEVPREAGRLRDCIDAALCAIEYDAERSPGKSWNQGAGGAGL